MSGIERHEILEIVDEVEDELEDEDFTFASREQILEGSFQRLRDRINRSTSTGTEQ